MKTVGSITNRLKRKNTRKVFIFKKILTSIRGKCISAYLRTLVCDQEPKPKNYGIQDGVERNTKHSENLFNEIIAENPPNLKGDVGIQTQKELEPQNRHSQGKSFL